MEQKLVTAHIGLKFGMSHVEGALGGGAEIAYICDSDPEALRFAGERYGIPEEKRVSDYRKIAEDPRVQAVTVAVPDQQPSRSYGRSGKSAGGSSSKWRKSLVLACPQCMLSCHGVSKCGAC